MGTTLFLFTIFTTLACCWACYKLGYDNGYRKGSRDEFFRVKQQVEEFIKKNKEKV